VWEGVLVGRGGPRGSDARESEGGGGGGARAGIGPAGGRGFSFFSFPLTPFFSFSKVYLCTFIHSRYFLGAKNEMLGETTCVKCY
jgi:hypothetical protein